MDIKLVVYEIEVNASTENFYSITSVNQFQSKLGQSNKAVTKTADASLMTYST